MKRSLVGLESLDPHSEKMEGIYKTDNFINDIAFGTSLFVLFDLNPNFQFKFAINFSQSPVVFFLKFKNGKIVLLKNLQFYMKMTDICDFLNVRTTDDNISKSFKYIGNNII